MNQMDERDAYTPEAMLRSDAAAITGANAGSTPYAADDTSPTESVPTYVFAGFWTRFWATLVDSLFLIGISFILFNPIRRATGYANELFSPIDLIETVFDFLYMVLLTWWTGQTLGKMLLGIRVVSAHKSNRSGTLSLGQVLLREVVGKLLSSIALGLGYIWVAFHKNKQGWHDLLAKTYVIKEQKEGSKS
jgi:uncharacterized RDD family membrane protein YckC